MNRTLLRDGAHLFALSGLAIAQPLYDLLGRNPEFFAVRGSGRWTILAFALALVLVPPAALFLVELAVELVRPRWRRAVHVALIGSLVALLALEALRAAPVPVALVLGIALGAAAAVLYARLAVVRSLLTVLALVPFVFLALFALTSSVSKLILPQDARAGSSKASGRTPVVLVVLDELAANSLLDGSRRIDAVRFPGFAELARSADWYRNATTVHESTTSAVPAILTGRYPRPGRAPVAAQYPDNLFTLLGGSYRLNVFENQTRLCPSRLCRGSSAGSFGGQLGSLLEDGAVVYAHRLLPKGLAKHLPTISESWGDFLGRSDDEPQRFDRFLSTLAPSGKPSLWFVHLLLPHSPWRYLPDGSTYETHYPEPPWGATEFWTKDAAIVLQSEQRYLLQLAYVDRLISRLIARLRATGLWDRALVIVTPDHGIGFTPGHKRRPVWPGNLHEIAFVPLFVKRPHQREGRVLDTHVETVDVLPTIARYAGADPGAVDGRALGTPVSRPTVVVRKSSGEKVSAPLAALLARRWAELRRQLALFGSGTPWRSLYGVGPDRALLGRPLPRGGGDIFGVSPEDQGPVFQMDGASSGRSVAIGVDDRVVAVAPVIDGHFWALVPRSALAPGGSVVTTVGVG